MELNNSLKKKNCTKSEHPKKTIKNIENGFKALNAKLDYYPLGRSKAQYLFSGYVKIRNFPFRANGKGTSKLLAKVCHTWP